MSEGRWFYDNVSKKTRNGSNMLFWHDPWLGWDVLKVVTEPRGDRG